MGYNKFIRSGNQFELYEYENECVSRGRPRGYKASADRSVLADSGKDTFQLARFIKRKDNAQRASLAFRRIVLSNLGTSENPLLLTITFKENRGSLSECSRFFNLFTTNLRYRYGKQFRYIAVPEFQKRGAVHYHALFWGLPNQELISERLTGLVKNVNAV